MANSRNQKAIERQLEDWVERGLIESETAARLRVDSASRSDASGVGAFAIFAVLGAALVGLGVILLPAHNWESLPRTSRAVLCFSLLLGGQGAAIHSLWRRASSTAWTEASALFLALATAAAKALLDQT